MYLIIIGEYGMLICPIASVCLYVCNPLTFESLDLVHLQKLEIEFVYEGHCVKVKVKGAVKRSRTVGVQLRGYLVFLCNCCNSQCYFL